MAYGSGVPAEIVRMRFLGPQYNTTGHFFRCLLQNEHGVNEMDITGTLLYGNPATREMYVAAKEQWERAQVLQQHQELSEMFEQAFVISPDDLSAALQALIAADQPQSE